MEEALPERSFPLPSPQPSRELLEGSWGLDLTPERDAKPRKRLRKPNSTNGELKECEEALPVSSLSVPQLNSTAVLCSKIHELKQQPRKARSISERIIDPSSNQSSARSVPAELSSIKENIADLEGILNQKPVWEVNIPRHTTRYSNLVSVDVSDESFQKLVPKPCKKKVRSVGSKPNAQGADDEGPSIMELKVSIAPRQCVIPEHPLSCTPDLEWEEAERTVDTSCYTASLEPLHPPIDAPFTLYRHMHHTLY